MRLQRDFFSRDTNIVSTELLGKVINFYSHQAIITEVESYIGSDDPACHAAKGLTNRTKVMFGPAGFSYVYLIYGMYHCLNFVTEKEGFPAASLIRGIKLLSKPYKFTNGPGKLCRYFNITKQHNNIDLILSQEFFISDTGLKLEYNTMPRIGISKGIDKLWRYVVPTTIVNELIY